MRLGFVATPARLRLILACALAAATALALAAESSEQETKPVQVAPAPAGSVQLLLHSTNGSVQVQRKLSAVRALVKSNVSDRTRTVQGVVQAILNGPTDEEKNAGLSSTIPAGAKLHSLNMANDSSVEIQLDLPDGIVGTKQYSPRLVHEMVEEIEAPLIEQGVRQFVHKVRDPKTGEFRGVLDFFKENTGPVVQDPTPVEDIAAAQVKASKTVLAKYSAPANGGQVTGALSGKAVVLNQAHGWLDDNSPAGWRIQRENLYEQMEDYECPETLNMYVVPALLNAGARVQPVREPDLQSNMVLIDNAAGSPTYVEAGTWGTSTATRGFVNKAGASWNGTSADPWANSSATRFATITGSSSVTATATYTPNIPVDGYYNVYISYSSGSNRYSQAHWQVFDTGGQHDYNVDETRDGATWYLLGNFYFKAGTNASTGKLVALNDGADSSKVITVDAVRFGGGMGDVNRRTHGLSGKLRYQEEAVYYLQYNGFLGSGLMSGDDTAGFDDEQLGWGDRSQYANWEQARDSEGNNTIYVGYHTNSLSGGCSGGAEISNSGRGTTTYRDVDADAIANTKSLTTSCHDAVISNIQKFYQSTWNDRGIVGSNAYGESSQGNLGGVAGFFFEALFHDNSPDMNASRDPKFRTAVARGIVQGVISYYGGTTFPPETPTSFRVKNNGGGQARLDWTAGPVRTASLPYGSAATSYRVFRSSDGFGFDQGTDAGNLTNYTLSLTAGQTTFFRIAAVNSAGISFPTETLAVRLPASGTTPVIIVNGYNRYDRFLAPYITGVTGCANNLVRQIDYRKFQRYNYIAQHALALDAAGVAFDSSADECVEQAQVPLGSYSMLDWIGGQEAEADAGDNVDDSALKSASMTAVQNFLQGGGKLFISNSELAWDFDRASGPTQARRDFLHNFMKASYSADDAATYQAAGVSGSIFASIASLTFDSGTGPAYDVRFPDVLNVNGSTACLGYVGGTGGTAAIQYSGLFNGAGTAGKIVYMGFGFETIVSTTTRNQLMNNILTYFAVSGATRVSGWEMY